MGGHTFLVRYAAFSSLVLRPHMARVLPPFGTGLVSCLPAILHTHGQFDVTMELLYEQR